MRLTELPQFARQAGAWVVRWAPYLFIALLLGPFLLYNTINRVVATRLASEVCARFPHDAQSRAMLSQYGYPYSFLVAKTEDQDTVTFQDLDPYVVAWRDREIFHDDAAVVVGATYLYAYPLFEETRISLIFDDRGYLQGVDESGGGFRVSCSDEDP